MTPASGPNVYHLELSVRLLRPFLSLIKGRGLASCDTSGLASLGPNARVPVKFVYELLEQLVKETGDHDIGLKAGSAFSYGDWGAFEYSIRTASTVVEAIRFARRSLRFLNDALDC